MKQRRGVEKVGWKFSILKNQIMMIGPSLHKRMETMGDSGDLLFLVKNYSQELAVAASAEGVPSK